MSNYTDKEVDVMVDMYTSNPCLEVVDKLSVKLNRPRKSIIAKLVKEGVYIKRGYRSKTGDVPITKLQIVRSIEDAVDCSLPGLDKTPKPTLKALEKSVVEMATLLEDTLEECRNLHDKYNVKSEMLDNLRKSDDPITILDEGRSKN